VRVHEEVLQLVFGHLLESKLLELVVLNLFSKRTPEVDLDLLILLIEGTDCAEYLAYGEVGLGLLLGVSHRDEELLDEQLYLVFALQLLLSLADLEFLKLGGFLRLDVEAFEVFGIDDPLDLGLNSIDHLLGEDALLLVFA